MKDINTDEPEPILITRSDLEKEINNHLRQNHGIALPDNMNYVLVTDLFRDQAQPWENLARNHMLNVWESVKYFVELLLQHLTDNHTYPGIMETVLDPVLEKMKENLLDKLRGLNSYHKRCHMLSLGEDVVSFVKKLRSNRRMALLEKKLNQFSATTNQKTTTTKNVTVIVNDLQKIVSDVQSHESAAAETIDLLQTYYDVSNKSSTLLSTKAN